MHQKYLTAIKFEEYSQILKINAISNLLVYLRQF